MGKKKINLDINTKEFEKRVRKAAKLAIDDVINNPNDGVIKTVKTKLQTAAKRELGDMSLRSKAQIAPNIDAIQKFEDTKKHVKKNLSSERYIINTPPENDGKTWSFTIKYDVPPDKPMWDWKNGDVNSVTSNGELLAQWVVDGKLLLHPSISIYRGYVMNASSFNNPNFYRLGESEFDPEPITWNQYTQTYTFKQINYVDHVIKELKKKEYVKSVTDSVNDKMNKYMKKIK